MMLRAPLRDAKRRLLRERQLYDARVAAALLPATLSMPTPITEALYFIAYARRCRL